MCVLFFSSFVCISAYTKVSFKTTWPNQKPPCLPNSAPERLIMSAFSFQTCNSPRWDLFARRCHVDVTRAVKMELVSMQTPNHEDCCAIDIRALSDTCTMIHPNLLDDDDVAHSAHVSLGTQKTVFRCIISSAILASCTLPIMDSKFWMSGGSDHPTLHVYHVCVSVHTLEQRSVGKECRECDLY